MSLQLKDNHYDWDSQAGTSAKLTELTELQGRYARHDLRVGSEFCEGWN